MKWPWKHKPKPKTQILEEEPPKDLDSLIEDYNFERSHLSWVAYENKGKIPDGYSRRLREIEEQIINLIPDALERAVLRIVARYEFDITDFIKQEDWREEFRKQCLRICHFLYYGSIYPTKPDRPALPFPGNEFFFWLLMQAKLGSQEDRLKNVSVALGKALDKGEILGCPLNSETLDSLSLRLFVVLAGEWAKQSAVLRDILCEVEGGELFIRELLGLEEKSSSTS